MCDWTLAIRRAVLTAACLSALLVGPTAVAQLTDDMVGQNEEAWGQWQAATAALERDDRASATTAFDAVAAMDLSDLRLALMADRTGSLRLEQWASEADAPDGIRQLTPRLVNGRRQKALAEDGWHFAAIGRFDYANANFQALDESNPDPVALLELARRNPNRHAILIKLLANADVGPAASRFLAMLGEGEERLRMDPYEIAQNIEKLGGPPRMAHNATRRLRESGEYAVPHLIQFLRDPDKQSLHPAIIQALPKIGRGAMNPLCIALGTADQVSKKVIIDALARIGYRQALAYLAKVADDSSASGECRAAAGQAMSTIGKGANSDRAQLFYDLAEGYYDDLESLRADARRDSANVWYLRDDELRMIEVPTDVWNDIMAMRCCEEALLARPDLREATALWLAANFRREAGLGMDVESEREDVLAAKDGTRPQGYPRSIYFARAAGPQYNHRVLARGFEDTDPGVALGAIAALAETAGAPSLVGAENLKQPLVATLSFPNRQVRIKAALALGRALPKTSFAGSQNVIPVLAEALSQAGRQTALIVDPDADSANKFQAIFRAGGFDCAVGDNVFAAREAGRRSQITSFDVILLASDIRQPDVAGAVRDLRDDLPTAATPILIVAKEGELNLANRVARSAHGVEVLLSDVTELGDPQRITEQVTHRVTRASQALGMSPLGKDLSLALALQSADVLRLIAENDVPVFDVSRAAPALIGALGDPAEALRIRAAHALALVAGAESQAAICRAALDEDRGADERVAMFRSLAESARRNGNELVGDEMVNRVIEFTMSSGDLVLRTAASQALGALDLPGNKASEIVRSQYKG